MNEDFKDELHDMDAAWSNAPENTDLPEGTYTMTISEGKLTKTKTSGKIRAAFCFVIAEGEHLGAKQWDGFMLDGENPIGMSFFKKFLAKLGYEIPASMAEINDVLEDITARNPIVSAQVVRKGDFTNVRVLELLGEGGGAPQQAKLVHADAPKVTAKPTPKPKTKAAVVQDDDAVEGDGEQVAFGVGDEVAFNDDEDNVIVGKITKIEGDVAEIETDDAVWGDIALENLRPNDGEEVVEEAEAEPADAVALRALLAAVGGEVTDDEARDDVVAKLAEYEWKRDEITEDEAKTLAGAGIAIVATPKPAPKPKAVAKPVAAPAVKPKPKGAAKAKK
jgi:hypothetical protein